MGQLCVQPFDGVDAGLVLGAPGLMPFSEHHRHGDVNQHESRPGQCLRVVGPRGDPLPTQPLPHGPQGGDRGGVIGLLAGEPLIGGIHSGVRSVELTSKRHATACRYIPTPACCARRAWSSASGKDADPHEPGGWPIRANLAIMLTGLPGTRAAKIARTRFTGGGHG